VAPEARSWAVLGGRESVAARASWGGWRWGMELIAGARLTERRGRGGRLGRRECLASYHTTNSGSSNPYTFWYCQGE
jgi:hypothetical protein